MKIGKRKRRQAKPNQGRQAKPPEDARGRDPTPTRQKADKDGRPITDPRPSRKRSLPKRVKNQLSNYKANAERRTPITLIERKAEMLISHNTDDQGYKKALSEAISKAKEIGKNLKTFEMEAEPVVREITRDGSTVTEVTLKATGADRNYSQFSINYLKGEIENHGNEATEVFSKLWKSQHMPKGDDVSPWIGRKTYPTIVETITGVPNDIDHVGSVGLLKGKTYDPADLKRWDEDRQVFEGTLKAKAPVIISAVRQQYEASIVLMATMNGKIEYKDLEKDFITTIDIVKTKTISNKRAELAYINKTLRLTRGTIHLYGKLKDLIKASGDLEFMKAQADAMELEKPLIEGEVRAYEEAEAKAARATAREDKKAEKDAEIQANVRLMAEAFSAATIAKILHLSENKVKEILKAAPAEAAPAEPAPANN